MSKLEQTSKENDESTSRASAILNSVHSTTHSLYQDYVKYYYSYLSTEISSRLASTSSSAPPPAPKRLDLNEVIKPLIELTSAAPEPRKPAPASVSFIRSRAEHQLSNEARLVELSDSLQRATSLLLKSELVADLFKLLYVAPELRFAVDKRRLPLISQLVQLKAVNAL